MAENFGTGLIAVILVIFLPIFGFTLDRIADQLKRMNDIAERKS